MRVSSRGDAEARYQSIVIGALARATELARERSAPAPVELKPVTSAALRVYEDTRPVASSGIGRWKWTGDTAHSQSGSNVRYGAATFYVALTLATRGIPTARSICWRAIRTPNTH